jgi:hypothetical protein
VIKLEKWIPEMNIGVMELAESGTLHDFLKSKQQPIGNYSFTL